MRILSFYKLKKEECRVVSGRHRQDQDVKEKDEKTFDLDLGILLKHRASGLITCTVFFTMLT